MPTLPAPARDVLLLLARLGLGITFFMHGWQKLTAQGVSGTQKAFASMGAPLPDVTAVVAIVLEVVGGLALLAGAFTTLVGVVLAVHMAAAALIAHLGNGFFVANGGPSYVIALGAGALALAAAGAGRFGLDAVLSRGARERVGDPAAA
ncbi:putative oxidoreductase [Knoellia remsis]|uniref:Putative oxidoreductase n=1 Tax=Knoellia remsis TaxID=407159 RepID=A0A2T0UQR2_9MICO|nr:DoxX family protein [Knoellia remsis]PRY60260.1 putative oxidoreductase [Knoellia remsis]